jgi:hypothetical protein
MPEDSRRRDWSEGRGTARGRDCCWYHAGDWRLACRLAVELLQEGRRLGLDDAQMVDFVRSEVDGKDPWLRSALAGLFDPAIAIGYDSNGFINGNHRGWAITESGAPHVIVMEMVEEGTEL